MSERRSIFTVAPGGADERQVRLQVEQELGLGLFEGMRLELPDLRDCSGEPVAIPAGHAVWLFETAFPVSDETCPPNVQYFPPGDEDYR